MEMAIVFHLVVAIANLAIGAYVLAKGLRSIVHRSFFVFTLGIFAWSSGMFLLYATRSPVFIAPTLWGGEITLLGFVLLAEVFPDEGRVTKRFLFFLAPFFALMALTPTRLFIATVNFSRHGYLEPENGPWFSVFLAVMAAYAAWSFWKFFHRYRRLGGVRRVQMAYLLMGAGVFIAAALTFDVLLPAFHIFTFNLLGPSFSLVFVICTAYAIVRHQLMDIEFVVKRGVTYALALITLAAIFFSTEFIFERFFEGLFYYDELVDIASGMVGGLLFSRIRRIFEALTDHLFFQKEYEYGAAVQNLGLLLNHAGDFETLVRSLDQFLMRTVKPERSSFYVKNADAPAFHREFLHSARATKNRAGAYEDLFEAMARDLTGPLFVEEPYERDGSAAAAAAERLGLAAIVPLRASEGNRGAIFLGRKLSEDVFGSKDRALLAVLSHQVGMAFENLHLYEAIKRHRDELEERIIARTARAKREQESQSKFLVDIAHELQTPIAILKANVDVAGGKQPGDRKTALRVMEMTLDRMSQMITNLLSVARLNFSKEKLHKMPIDVHTMFEGIYGDCLALAEEKWVTLSFSSGPVMISGDRNKLKEVILNLVSNALKHTPRGGSITLRARRVEDAIEVSVIDTGSGIPAENLPHIFERFYRIDGTSSSGTGLGLSICRQIVEAHGGSIRAESEPGAGSSFIVTLPRYVAPEREEKQSTICYNETKKAYANR